jgi:hypothetical protein
MDKYYEMTGGKNWGNKVDFFNSPEDVEDSDNQTQMGDLNFDFTDFNKLGVEWGGVSWVCQSEEDASV